MIKKLNIFYVIIFYNLKMDTNAFDNLDNTIIRLNKEKY